MAASFVLKCAFFRPQQQLLSFNSGPLSLCLKNTMSQYPSFYIKPIVKKDQLEELYKSGEAQKMFHVPTRAALNDQTSSAFHDEKVNLFINYLMRDGNKILARELVEKTFERVKRLQLEKYHKAKTDEDKANILLDPKQIFLKAVENCKPVLQLTPIKRGGVKYQVPVPITHKRSQFLSMKWIIEAASEKERNIRVWDKLASELIDASNNTGRVIKRKHEMHRQCEANRAYAHYRWS